MPPMSRNFVFVLILIYLVVGLVSFISVLNHNFKALSKNTTLENKILDAQLQIKAQELVYLKKQIHPHFLFNSLNTIYGFALKQSIQTPDIILKFSNLLDYILYQVQETQVPMAQEILHIEEYVSLEKIRFQDTLQVTIEKQEISEDILIPPMLFLPFVENAFKHGAIINGNLRINLSFKIEAETIKFSIFNTVKPILAKPKSPGIGLETIKKRLELLYPDTHNLTYGLVGEHYKVQLEIKRE